MDSSVCYLYIQVSCIRFSYEFFVQEAWTICQGPSTSMYGAEPLCGTAGVEGVKQFRTTQFNRAHVTGALNIELISNWLLTYVLEWLTLPVINIATLCCYVCLQGTAQYDLVLVGHSLGAGVAAILAVLLHQEYPTLHCYAYSPPGSLMRYWPH